MAFWDLYGDSPEGFLLAVGASGEACCACCGGPLSQCRCVAVPGVGYVTPAEVDVASFGQHGALDDAFLGLLALDGSGDPMTAAVAQLGAYAAAPDLSPPPLPPGDPYAQLALWAAAQGSDFAGAGYSALAVEAGVEFADVWPRPWAWKQRRLFSPG